MGLKRSFALLVDDSAPVNLSAVGGRRQGSAGDNGANDSKPQLEVKRSISEDLSIEDERRRKRLCCLISRIEIGGPKNSEWNIATAGAEVQTKMEPEVKMYGCKNCKIRLCLHPDIISRVRTLFALHKHRFLLTSGRTFAANMARPTYSKRLSTLR
jgi:hypothetical protein